MNIEEKSHLSNWLPTIELDVTEFGENMLITLAKIKDITIKIFRFLVMLPIICIDTILHGSIIDFISDDKHNFKKSDETVKQDEIFAKPKEVNIDFYPSGPESLEMKKNMIDKAQYSIEIIGSYFSGKPLDDFLELFEKKLNTNNQIIIRVIACPHLITKEQKNEIKRLQIAYPKQFHFLIGVSTWEILPKMKLKDIHTKMTIVDQKYFMTGGNNLMNSQLSLEELKASNSSAIGGNNQDIDIAGKGIMARQLKTLFDEYWIKHKNKSGKEIDSIFDKGFDINDVAPDKLATVQELDNDDKLLKGDCSIFTSTSQQGINNQCEIEYLKMIQSAKNDIIISNMLFNKKSIIRAVGNAIRRGINVKILTNGDGNSLDLQYRIQSSRSLRNISRLFEISRLPKAGKMNLLLQEKEDTYLHTKIMVVDSKIFVIGSFNIDRKSSRNDDEMILVFRSQKIAEHAIMLLDNIENNLQSVTEDLLNSHPIISIRNLGIALDRPLRHIV